MKPFPPQRHIPLFARIILHNLNTSACGHLSPLLPIQQQSWVHCMLASFTKEWHFFLFFFPFPLALCCVPGPQDCPPNLKDVLLQNRVEYRTLGMHHNSNRKLSKLLKLKPCLNSQYEYIALLLSVVLLIIWHNCLLKEQSNNYDHRIIFLKIIIYM